MDLPSAEPATLSETPGLRAQLDRVREALRRAEAGSQPLVDAERRRIAQMLHDTVSQTMTSVYLQAMFTAKKLETNQSETAGDVAQLAEMIHQAVVELQGVVRQLQPSADEPAGSGG